MIAKRHASNFVRTALCIGCCWLAPWSTFFWFPYGFVLSVALCVVLAVMIAFCLNDSAYGRIWEFYLKVGLVLTVVYHYSFWKRPFPLPW